MRALNVFFKEEKNYNEYMALRGAGAGALDMYDNFKKYIVYGNSMLSETLDQDDCVPIWANTLRIPDMDVVTTYAHRLSNLDTTIDNLILLCRNPVIISAERGQVLSMQNAWRQVQEGEPVIFGSEHLGQQLNEGVTAFPATGDKGLIAVLQVAKSRIWNEGMTFLGINNSNQDKRERLVANEVSANDAQVNGFRNSALSARQLACERINKKYGLNVSVEWNTDVGNGMTDAPVLGQDQIVDNESRD
jgi:hypothetical protein